MTLPTPTLELLPFWTINAGLDTARLCAQLRDMQTAGFDGAVWHPRFYPDDPPYLSPRYFDILSAVILHAKALGMKFWLYDENGWPSGIAGGALPRQFPEYRSVWLTTRRAGEDSAAQPLCSFELDGRHVSLNPQRGSGLDYLNPAAVQQFFALALDSHRDGLAREAFDHIEAVFTDEPVLGCVDEPMPRLGIVPWTPELPQRWRDRFGDDLVAQLPLLFRRESGSAAFRIRFREFLTDLFITAFFAPYNRWCAQHGKRFTGHVKGEEHPLFQVPLNGSCHQLFQHMALPGIDSLERYPQHNFYPRQVASAARQFGDGRAMVECFGGSGWGVEPQHFLNYLGWLAGNGLTTFVTHLYQYRMSSAAARDWPPSIPNHLTWKDAFPAVVEALRRQVARQSSRADADLLVVAPQRAVMAAYEPWELSAFDIHKCARYADSPAARVNRDFLDFLTGLDARGVAYHLCDERTLEQHGRSTETGRLAIGSAAYRRVLAAAHCRFAPTAEPLLRAHQISLAEIGTPPAVAATACPVTGGNVRSLTWRLETAPENVLVLEPVRDTGTEQAGACFILDDVALLGTPLQLVLLDPPRDLFCNDRALPVQAAADDWRAELTGTVRTGQNILRFAGHAADNGPLFLFLEGRFAVHSRTPWSAGPGATRRTDGPFALKALPHGLDVSDLLAAGLPFCREPVRLVTDVATAMLPAGARLQLGRFAGAAARVRVDGCDCGWCWAPAWEVVLTAGLQAGQHRVELLLYPNTLNFFGPHHHCDGDLAVTSPDQFTGRKNFADRPDAPADTRVTAWHFRPWGCL